MIAAAVFTWVAILYAAWLITQPVKVIMGSNSGRRT